MKRVTLGAVLRECKRRGIRFGYEDDDSYTASKMRRIAKITPKLLKSRDRLYEFNVSFKPVFEELKSYIMETTADPEANKAWGDLRAVNDMLKKIGDTLLSAQNHLGAQFNLLEKYLEKLNKLNKNR